MANVRDSLLQKVPSTRQQILAEFRGELEIIHRQLCYYFSTKRPFDPCQLPPGACSRLLHDNVEDLGYRHAEDCCNKNVPIYIVSSRGQSTILLSYALHNWLYHRWYQPYRNHIEYFQFIAKLFLACPSPVDMPLQSLVKLITELHGRICKQVTSYQDEVVTLPVKPEYLGGPNYRDQQFLIL
jgi:hypothetical protein